MTKLFEIKQLKDGSFVQEFITKYPQKGSNWDKLYQYWIINKDTILSKKDIENIIGEKIKSKLNHPFQGCPNTTWIERIDHNQYCFRKNPLTIKCDKNGFVR